MLHDFFNYNIYQYNQSAVSLLFLGFLFTLFCLTLLVFLCIIGYRLLTIWASVPHLSPRILLLHVSKLFGETFYRIACLKLQLSSSSPTIVLLIILLHTSMQKESCTWVIKDNQDFFNHWIFIQYIFADGDTKVSKVYDAYGRGLSQAYMVVDQKGGFK